MEGFSLCPPTAEWREKLQPDEETTPPCLAPAPPPPPTHTQQTTCTCMYSPSDRPGTNHNGTMTYKPQPHGNYSQAFKSDSIKSQLRQQCRGGAGGCPIPSRPEASHSNTPSFNELTQKQKKYAGHTGHSCFVSDILYVGRPVEGFDAAVQINK